ncbi:MAG: UDP-N-acetylmuramoyl-L-alanine--D-glutamate ligase [Anaerolineae bacterium]
MHRSLSLAGLRALVVGLGREGSALARYLARHGLTVTATDLRPAARLTGDVAGLEAMGVDLVLGEHPLALLDRTDLVFASPGVPLTAPFLQAAQGRGLPLSTESRLFCQVCPAPITGITGSSGKTTTATLAGQMLKADGRPTWVGGNIGRPLIGDADSIRPGDAVVMELSSFQLEYFHPALNRGAQPVATAIQPLLKGWSPPIAAILNVTPNHLDRHGGMQDYIRAKRAIMEYQKPEDNIILNLDDEVTRSMKPDCAGQVTWFSRRERVERGAGLDGDRIVLRRGGGQETICRRAEVQLRGEHNLSNVLAACALAGAAGVTHEAMAEAITGFQGVEHRLELVRERAGVRYLNDSIATSPERLAAALRSFDEPLILLAGGRDKHLPWDEAARLIRQRASHLILFGEAADLIARAVDEAGQQEPAPGPPVQQYATLEEAVAAAAQAARPGDVVLLSPGCASFDAFEDFAARGERFRELVERL